MAMAGFNFQAQKIELSRFQAGTVPMKYLVYCSIYNSTSTYLLLN